MHQLDMVFLGVQLYMLHLDACTSLSLPALVPPHNSTQFHAPQFHAATLTHAGLRGPLAQASPCWSNPVRSSRLDVVALGVLQRDAASCALLFNQLMNPHCSCCWLGVAVCRSRSSPTSCSSGC